MNVLFQCQVQINLLGLFCIWYLMIRFKNYIVFYMSQNELMVLKTPKSLSYYITGFYLYLWT